MLMTWVLRGQAGSPLCVAQPSSLFLRVFHQVICHALQRHAAPSLHLPLILEKTFLHTLVYFRLVRLMGMYSNCSQRIWLTHCDFTQYTLKTEQERAIQAKQCKLGHSILHLLHYHTVDSIVQDGNHQIHNSYKIMLVYSISWLAQYYLTLPQGVWHARLGYTVD